MDIFKYQNDGLVFICGDFNSKCKLAGGVPYNVFTKLYDAVVIGQL